MSDLFHPDVPDEFIADVFAVMSLLPQHTFQVLTKRQRSLSTLADPDWRYKVQLARIRLQQQTGLWTPPTWPWPNIWLGVSVENQRYADLRIPHLLATPAAVRFLSIEPLLGPVVLRHEWLMPRANVCGTDSVTPEAQNAIRDIVKAAGGKLGWTGIDWCIVGGESGPGARPMHPDWVRDLRDQCVAAGVPFFFKQWGEWAPRGDGRSPSFVLGDGRYASAVTDCERIVGQPEAVVMSRVGKKAAGRELDGRTWDEMPEVTR